MTLEQHVTQDYAKSAGNPLVVIECVHIFIGEVVTLATDVWGLLVNWGTP